MNHFALDIVEKFIKKNWYSSKGLFASYPFVFAIVFLLSDKPLSKIYIIISTILCIVVTLIWRNSQPEKIPEGMIGIGLAIFKEDDGESGKIYSDLIDSFKNVLLENSYLKNRIIFRELNEVIASQIVLDLPSKEKADYWTKKLNISFLFFGGIKLRDINNKPTFVLDIQGIVRHKKIDEIVQNVFAKEFSESLPKILISKENHFSQMEFVAKYIDVVAKYILGVAVYFSFDFSTSSRLLAEAENKLEKLLNNNQYGENYGSYILSNIRKNIINVYISWQRFEWKKYVISKNDDYLMQARKICEKIVSRDSRNLEASLKLAISYFMMERDIASSKEFLLPFVNEKNPAVLFSLAFLEGYEGNLDTAYDFYKKGFRLPVDDLTVYNQCDEFMGEVLRLEPDKGQIHYCSGLLNYKGKKDFISAERDFKNFLNSACSMAYPRQVEATQIYLKEIQGG